MKATIKENSWSSYFIRLIKKEFESEYAKNCNVASNVFCGKSYLLPDEDIVVHDSSFTLLRKLKLDASITSAPEIKETIRTFTEWCFSKRNQSMNILVIPLDEINTFLILSYE